MFFMLFDILFNLNFRYLNIVKKSFINILILIFTLALHPLWCYIFINIFDLGVKGGAISLLISQFLNAFLGTIYIIWWTPYPDSIFFFNKKSFKKWGEYLSISIPATFLFCAELWAFECLAIVAIICSDLDYSVYVLVMQVMNNTYAMSLGFANACTIIAGEYVSQNNLVMLHKIRNTCIIYGMTFMLLVCALLLSLREYILLIFLDDKEINDKGKISLIYIAFAQFGDLFQAVFQGYFRAVGKHLIASLIAFTNYYIVMLGLAVVFGIVVDMNVYGINLAYLISTSICAVVYFLIEKYTFNYEKIFHDTNKRVARASNMSTIEY